MRVLILCVLVAAVSAIAPLRTVRNPIPGRYNIKLKAGYDVDTVLPSLARSFAFQLSEFQVTKKFRKVFSGFSASLSKRAVELLRQSRFVDVIEEDGLVKASTLGSWGLDRIDQLALPMDDVYNPVGDGTGVHVYVIDTGINWEHTDFEGRAESAYDALGGTGVDCNGHGSHCSGTVGGTAYGVAKNVRVYGVRVLNCFGSGSYSSIIDALDWISQNGNRPAIGSMSLGGGASSLMDDAVEAIINDGIQVAVAAGNDDADACNYSPARTGPAITVGATDNTDTRAYFSNYGTCVDIFAPGVDITSVWRGAADAINTISGTSMACPHVAGAAAIFLANNPSLSPAQLKLYMLSKSIANAINDEGTGSPDLLLFVGNGTGGGEPGDPSDPEDPVPEPPNGCGGYFNVSGATFTSPNYPSDYDNSASCTFVIEAPAGEAVQLSFNDFNLESHSTCNFDSVKVYDGLSTSNTQLANLCGTAIPSDVYSSGNGMLVQFTSDSSVTDSGFSATVSFGGERPKSCGDTWTNPTGVIQSPNYPSAYDNNAECSYHIQGPGDNKITLDFTFFELESSSTCAYDYVDVYDGPSSSSTLLARLCGTDTPSSFYSSGPDLFVDFHTDSSVTYTGFSANYNIL